MKLIISFQSSTLTLKTSIWHLTDCPTFFVQNNKDMERKGEKKSIFSQEGTELCSCFLKSWQNEDSGSWYVAIKCFAFSAGLIKSYILVNCNTFFCTILIKVRWCFNKEHNLLYWFVLNQAEQLSSERKTKVVGKVNPTAYYEYICEALWK